MNKTGHKLLFSTADEFPPFRPDAEVLFGKELLMHGFQVDWIMQPTDSATTARRISWNGCNVWLAARNNGTSRLSRLRKHLSNVRNDFRVSAVVREYTYDCIQVKDKFVGAIPAMIVSRRHGLPFFYWLSFPFPEASLELAKRRDSRYPVFYWIRGMFFALIFYKIICRLADHIFVQSDEMRRKISEKGVPMRKMTPVPMGVDMDTFAAAMDSSRAPTIDLGKSISIVYLGALDRARSLEFLVDVFGRISDRFPTTKLIFVGDSDDPMARRFLEDEARRHGVLDRVQFTGFLPRKEALQFVASAAVGVALTKDDTSFGVASSTKLIEYMAMAKPVLANVHPDQSKVIHESGGGICAPWDVDEFTEALIWLLEHPDEARIMGARGREYVGRERSYAIIAGRLARKYKELLGGASAETIELVENRPK